MDLTTFLPVNVIFLAIAVYIVTLITLKCFPIINFNIVLKRMYPLFPLLLSVGGAFIPGVFPGLSVGMKILNGCVSCFTAVYLNDIIKKTALGDVKIKPMVDIKNEEPEPPK